MKVGIQDKGGAIRKEVVGFTENNKNEIND